MKKWVHVMDELAEWAKSKDCTHMESHARLGWERVLKNYNFQKLLNFSKENIQKLITGNGKFKEYNDLKNELESK